MDIARLSMDLSQTQLLNNVGFAMMAKNLDMAEAQGEMTAELISSMPSPSLESLVNPAIGGNIDLAI